MQEESEIAQSESLHSDSIHEDGPERPNYVPNTTADGAAAGGLILKRKMTLNKSQIDAVKTPAAAEHNSLLDCFMCNNIMIAARECNSCRKGFCKKCIDEHINSLIVDECEVQCPSCSKPDFKIVDPHPLL